MDEENILYSTLGRRLSCHVGGGKERKKSGAWRHDVTNHF
jgi:hypothetical protein